MAIREITYSEVEKALADTPEFCESMRDARFRPIFGNTVSSICDGAFKNCKNIVLGEKLPPSISVVDMGAFQNCTSITHFSLPGIAYIGKNVFDGCTSLSAFDFTEDNLSIGNYAFAGTALSVVRLPNLMDKVDECAFYDCSSLVNASGNNITSIQYNAFYNCMCLSNVDFPKLKSLYRGAFAKTNFRNVDLSTVKYIDDGVFRSAEKLETVCFSNCTSASEYGQWELFHSFNGDSEFPALREIKLPKLTTLQVGIAANLPSLSSIDVCSLEELGVWNTFVSNCPHLSALNLPALKNFHGHYIAYECSSLNDVNLQNLLSSSEDRLFCKCHNLSVINLPEYVYSGDGIAWNCNSLNTINMPKLLDTYNPIAYDCSALTAITVPKLSSIGKFGLFDNCINVMSVYIDNDILHSINDGQIIAPTSADGEWKWVSPKIDHVANDNIVELPAGDYAKNLRYVDCANTVNCYAEFSENKNLLYVNLPALSVVDLNFDSCENLLSLDFSSAKYLFCNPDDMIGSGQSLRGCVNLSAIKLSGDLRAVGYDIFNDTQLYKMQIASGNPLFEIDGGYCIKALNPTLSSYASRSIKLIGPLAWYDNGYELTAIDLPNCRYINADAFCETAVQTAKLDNVKAIDDAAFSYTCLSSIMCPKVEELGIEAFSYTCLSDLNIPMCHTIGVDAFVGSPLTSIYVANDVLHSIGNGYGLDNALVVNANETELVEFARGITHINNATISALRAESSIHSTELVDLQLSRLDCLDRMAIWQCTNLSTISLDSVTFMSHQSIYDCQNLSSISIPSIRELNYWAIYNCKNLLSIVMSSLTSVPDIVDGTQGPFYQLHPDYKVYVNADIRNTMANTGWWKTIADKIVAL